MLLKNYLCMCFVIACACYSMHAEVTGRVEGVTSLLTPCCGASFVSDGAMYVRVAVHKLLGCSVPDSHLTVCHDLQAHAIISSVYVLRDQTQFPDLRSKRLYPLNHLPGPGCAFM